MKWLLAGPLAAFDVESTGVNVEEDRIVTATVATLMPGTPWAVDAKSWLIDPGIDIPEAATQVHGITSVQAKEHGEQPIDALNDIAFHLARGFLAHIPVIVANGAYDFTILDRELRRHGLPTVDARAGTIGPVVDVMVVDKWLDPYRSGGKKLTDLCQFYNVRLDGAHDAAADAMAAARVAYRIALRTQENYTALTDLYAGLGRRNPQDIADRYMQLGEMTAVDLHDAQVGWRADQMASLAEYFDRKGISHDGCDPSWPMRPYQPTATLEEAPLW